MLINPHLKTTILEVVENQIRDGNPPETRQTLEWLLAAGHSRKQAVEMIGSALVEEIWAILHNHRPFDRAQNEIIAQGFPIIRRVKLMACHSPLRHQE